MFILNFLTWFYDPWEPKKKTFSIFNYHFLTITYIKIFFFVKGAILSKKFYFIQLSFVICLWIQNFFIQIYNYKFHSLNLKEFFFLFHFFNKKINFDNKIIYSAKFDILKEQFYIYFFIYIVQPRLYEELGSKRTADNKNRL